MEVCNFRGLQGREPQNDEAGCFGWKCLYAGWARPSFFIFFANGGNSDLDGFVLTRFAPQVGPAPSQAPLLLETLLHGDSKQVSAACGLATRTVEYCYTSRYPGQGAGCGFGQQRGKAWLVTVGNAE